MPIYNYQAFDTEGTLHKGSKDAASESEVRQFLGVRETSPKEIVPNVFTKQMLAKLVIQEK